MPTLTPARAAFHRLHESGCFIIPNPWDVGSARYLRRLGFQALATTSSGFAFSRGLPDGAVSRDEVLRHLREIVAATDLPVNADFESGHGDTPEQIAESVRLCVETGVAGLSIEDASRDETRSLLPLDAALAQVRAARAAIDASGTGVLLTARAECYLIGHPDALQESIRRLQAYAEAGADVLYAPGPRTREDIAAIVAAVAPKPVNHLMSASTGLRLSDLAELGVRRVSVGSALARAAWTGFLGAARKMAEEGSFAGFDGLASARDLNEFFRTEGDS
jgi:2-methylisocitrate lyase-like PEP mutase family enzyme